MDDKKIARVTHRLPSSVKEFTWRRNHHWIELEDEDGNRVRLEAISLIKGQCTACKLTVYAMSRYGRMVCPHCASRVAWVWGRGQLAFVPEGETEFDGGVLVRDDAGKEDDS